MTVPRIGWNDTFRFVGLNGSRRYVTKYQAIRVFERPRTALHARLAKTKNKREARQEEATQYLERVGAVGNAAPLLFALHTEVQSTPGSTVADFSVVLTRVVAGRALQREVSRLNDRLLAYSCCSRWTSPAASLTVEMRKLAHLADTVTNAPLLYDGGIRVDHAMNHMTFVLPSDVFHAAVRSFPASLQDDVLSRKKKVKEGDQKITKPRRALRRALKELLRIREQLQKAVKDVAGESWANIKRLKAADMTGWAKRLSADSLDALKHFGVKTGKRVAISDAIEQVRDVLDSLEPEPGQPPRKVAVVGGTVVDLRPRRRPSTAPKETDKTNQPKIWPHVHRGDLLVVREKLKAYELAEFSEVQNMLAGEYKEDRRRVLSRSESQLVERTEIFEEKETETKTTERSEIQVEAEKSIQTDFEASASLNVNGKYGPSVTFTAEVAGSLKRSTTESSRRAETFAKEVVNRALERVTRRSMTERTRKLLQETEDHTVHGFDNRSRDKHVRGIYRWLTKIVELQVYNLGHRTLVEMIIPEPAAVYRALLAQNPPATALVLTEPREPMRPGASTPPDPDDILTPTSDWLDEDWGSLAQEYGVTGIAPPKKLSIHESADFAEKKSSDLVVKSGTITIDSGYQVEEVMVKLSLTRIKAGSNYYVKVRVGNYLFYDNQGNGSDLGWKDVGPYRNEVPYAIMGFGVNAAVGNIMLKCVPTSELRAQWRAATYDAIMDGYRRKLQDFQDELRQTIAQEAQRRAPNAHPIELERVIRTELQRSFVSLLLEREIDLDAFDAFDPEKELPKLDFNRARKEASLIAFLQQGFEWENMSFVFYPYFWGRTSTWASAVTETAASDPKFSTFLKAGAARVQVPVRPEFENVMRSFLDHGELWPSSESFAVDGSSDFAITEEQLIAAGVPTEGEPIGSPWEARIPTSLVMLHPSNSLSLRDPLSAELLGDTPAVVADHRLIDLTAAPLTTVNAVPALHG